MSAQHVKVRSHSKWSRKSPAKVRMLAWTQTRWRMMMDLMMKYSARGQFILTRFQTQRSQFQWAAPQMINQAESTAPFPTLWMLTNNLTEVQTPELRCLMLLLRILWRKNKIILREIWWGAVALRRPRGGKRGVCRQMCARSLKTDYSDYLINTFQLNQNTLDWSKCLI